MRPLMLVMSLRLAEFCVFAAGMLGLPAAADLQVSFVADCLLLVVFLVR